MRTEIRNTKGEIIFESDEPLDRAYLEDRDLSDAMFENANLEGICWMGTVLRNANLKMQICIGQVFYIGFERRKS